MMRASKSKLARLFRDDRLRIKHFAISGLVFLSATPCSTGAETNIAPSLRQELISLACLMIGGLAFCWAMLMQILFILSRILK